MSYHTTNIILKKYQKNELNYCIYNSHLAKLFKNSVIFRLRQLYFAKTKDFKNLTTLEQSVLDEFKLTEDRFKPISNKYFIPNFKHFVYLFTVTNNSDYFNDLPMQSSQQVIKEALQDFKSFKEALKDYYKNPANYTGRPKLPGYIKADYISFDITNQDAVIYTKDDFTFLKLPKTKLKINLGNLRITNLKEVTIKPFYNTFKICLISEIENSNTLRLDENRILGIDLGIDNIISTSNNCGLTPFIIKGNELKSLNQWYNKLSSNLKSLLPVGQYSSNQLQSLHKYRNLRINDFYNKISSYVINYCISNNIGTIVIGKNAYWKQNSNINKINNQNFCFLSHTYLINKIKEMSKKIGVKVIEQEESYTSKASFLDMDDLPTFDAKNTIEYNFSGKRVKRGLYQSKEGILLNADINGASNIIRKAIKDAFNKIKDFSYLYETVEVIKIS